MYQTCKLKCKTLGCLPCSKNIFKLENTAKKPKSHGNTTSSCNCYKSLNIRNFSKFQDEVETRLHKLHFVSQA